ncbi:hypothetical protein CEXT_8941 [Caerostris extrusa]|uniref:Uncharacterized protein n=1 Tax=Caerostris extrusa TaxID=172846 RepID=A0AAV4U6Y8_CAEEX|nr:hypothetical protein CEXT_8941 [Caerostris extrusa]
MVPSGRNSRSQEESKVFISVLKKDNYELRRSECFSSGFDVFINPWRMLALIEGKRFIDFCWIFQNGFDGFYRGRKTVVGKSQFHYTDCEVFMDWFVMDLIEVTGMILLIGFVGKKMKDFGYDWTDYDCNKKDPFEVELLGYGCIVLIVYWHFFMIFIRWQPIFTLLVTGVLAETFRVHFNSWDVIKAELSFLKN